MRALVENYGLRSVVGQPPLAARLLESSQPATSGLRVYLNGVEQPDTAVQCDYATGTITVPPGNETDTYTFVYTASPDTGAKGPGKNRQSRRSSS